MKHLIISIDYQYLMSMNEVFLSINDNNLSKNDVDTSSHFISFTSKNTQKQQKFTIKRKHEKF
jgi:hypothetical protein